MKKNLYILVSILGSMILLAGCQKDGKLFDRNNGEFRFGAKANSGPLTRTAYGDYTTDEETGKKTHQDIKWQDGDEIRIYSPTATRRVGVEKGESALYYWADYKIVPDATDSTKATIQNLSNDGNYTQAQVGANDIAGNGLAWVRGQESAEHVFYAVYPSVKLRGVSADEGTGKTVTEGSADLAGTQGNLALFIPETQAFSEMGNLDSYGNMTAYAKGKGTDKSISMEFEPAYTTFEISIRSADEAIGLSSFSLISNAASETATAAPLAGYYAAQYDADGNLTFAVSDADKTAITVNLNGKSAPAASEEKDLVFSVLALPQDLTNLSVSFTLGNNAGTRTLALTKKGTDGSYAPITFSACRKHRIYGLVLSNGELLISVGTAPWLAGSDTEYTTIENVTTFFVSYQRYNEQNFYDGNPSWNPPYYNYVAIAPGRSTTERVDPDDETSALTNLPLYSPMLTLTTVSVRVPLELRSDNANIGFVTKDASGIYSTTPSQTLPIRASEDLDDEVVTEYFVVPVGDSAIGQSANITLYRTDCNAPIAYSHKDMPGTTDHLKVPFMVLSVSDYQNKTNTEVPSI